MSIFSDPSEDDFLARALAHIRSLDEAATEVTEALGLPPDQKGSVLRALYGVAAQSLAVTEAPPDAPSMADVEQARKQRILQLTQQFVAARMQAQARRLTQLWQRLSDVSTQFLASEPVQPAPAASGLGFAGRSDELLSVVSVISWAVLRASEGEFHLTEEEVVRQARARGCSTSLSYAIARYLLAEMSA